MKRKIEVTEKVLKLGKLGNYDEGDVKWFDEDVAQMIIDNGWGKDVETGEQGERKPGSVRLEVDSVIQKL